MHKGLIAIFLGTALLAGCASKEPRQAYQEPQSGLTSFVTFRNATPGRVGVAVYESAAACTDRRFIPDLLLGEERTVAVPGGEPVAFTFRYTIPNRTPDRYCEVTASIETVPNGRYEAAIRPHGDTSCTVEVARIERDSTGRITQRGGVKALMRAPVKSSTEAGPFCAAVR